MTDSQIDDVDAFLASLDAEDSHKDVGGWDSGEIDLILENVTTENIPIQEEKGNQIENKPNPKPNESPVNNDPIESQERPVNADLVQESPVKPDQIESQATSISKPPAPSRISIASNLLKSTSSFFRDLSKEVKLQISPNPISVQSPENDKNSIPGNSESSLTAGDTGVKEDVIELLKETLRTNQDFSGFKLLEFFNFVVNHRGLKGTEKIAASLKNAGGNIVVSMDLSGVAFSQQLGETLAELFEFCRYLRRLSLEGANIDSQTIRLLLKALILHDHLQWLNVAYCHKLQSKGLKFVSIFLQKSTVLRFLDISGIQLDISAASLMSKALKGQINSHPCPLECLRMNSCGIHVEMLEELVPGIVSSSIKSLMLRNNSLGSLSGHLIGSLVIDSKIERLDLSDNNLQSVGIQPLCSSLYINSILKDLRLRNNSLDPISLELISVLISKNKFIETLDIGSNPNLFSEYTSVTLLKDSFARNTTLKVFIADNVGLKFDSAIALAEALPECHLMQLKLTGNDSAVNPLRATFLNPSQTFVSWTQRATKNVLKASGITNPNTSSELLPIEGSSFSKTAGGVLQSFIQAPIGNPVDTALSTLMAFVASLRLNHTITSLELFQITDSEKESDSQIKHDVRLKLAEIVSICERNAKSLSIQKGQSENELFDIEQVPNALEIASQNLNLINQMINAHQKNMKSDPEPAEVLFESDLDLTDDKYKPSNSWSQSELEVLKQLHANLVSNRDKLLKFVDIGVVAKDDYLREKITNTLSEIASAVKECSLIDIETKNNTSLKERADRLPPVITPVLSMSSAKGNNSEFLLDSDED